MNTSELKSLLIEIRDGGNEAFESLLEAYKPLVDSMANRYAGKNGVSADDTVRQEMRQDARLALYKAAMTYDTDSDAVSFGLYAKVCIRNALVSELRKITSADRRGRKAMDSARQTEGSDDSARERVMLLSAVKNTDCGLSGYEKAVMMMMLDGKTVAQIAEITGKDAKSVSNAVFRAKRKVRTIIE